MKMVKRNHVLALALGLLILGAFTYPMWSPQVNQWLSMMFGGWQPPPQVGGEVTLSVSLIDADDGSAVSPAGISVMFYVWDFARYGYTLPTHNIDPMTEIGAGSETPDGEFTTSATTEENSWVYIYITDSGDTFQTTYSIQQVPPVLHQGIDREAILEPVLVNPRSALSRQDVAIMITSEGAEIDNSSNWAFGQHDITVTLSTTAGNAWGNRGYIDPSTKF